MNHFNDSKTAKILSLDYKNELTPLENLKITFLRDCKDVFNEFPTLHSLSLVFDIVGAGIPDDILSIYSFSFAKKDIPNLKSYPMLDSSYQSGSYFDMKINQVVPGTFWEVRIRDQVSDAHLDSYCKNVKPQEQLIPHTIGKSLEWPYTPQVERVSYQCLEETIKSKFLYLRNISSNEVLLFQKDLLSCGYHHKEGKQFKLDISPVNIFGQKNHEFDNEMKNFLGEELLRKTHYFALAAQLPQKAATKKRKI